MGRRKHARNEEEEVRGGEGNMQRIEEEESNG
jgi:hypothetical protein